MAEQTKTAAIQATIELEESAARDDGTFFSDHQVRMALVRKRFKNTEGDLVSWSFFGAKGVTDEVPDATVREIAATVEVPSL